jgi:hypothetical protein
MAERSNAAVLKTVVRLSVDRGFESLFLRQMHQIPPPAFAGGFLFFYNTVRSLLRKGIRKNKNHRQVEGSDAFDALPQGITDEPHSGGEEVIPIEW